MHSSDTTPQRSKDNVKPNYTPPLLPDSDDQGNINSQHINSSDTTPQRSKDTEATKIATQKAPGKKSQTTTQPTITEICDNLYKNYMIDGYFSIELEAILHGDMNELLLATTSPWL